MYDKVTYSEIVDEKVLDDLMAFDPSLERLVKKYIYNEKQPYASHGLIADFLEHYDPISHMFGGGVYAPPLHAGRRCHSGVYC